MKVILICTSGISSGYYARKIERSLKEAGLQQASCEALGYFTFLKKDIEANLVAIGPIGEENISKVKAKCEEKQLRYMAINSDDYVAMNTEIVAQWLSQQGKETKGV